MSQKIKSLFLIGLPAIIATLLVVAIIYAWTEPSQAPPGGNVPAPINVGSSGQSKKGNLALNTDGTLAYGLLVPYGNVGIGTTAPGAKLDVGGNIRAFRSSTAVQREINIGVDSNNRAVIYQPANSNELRFFISDPTWGGQNYMTLKNGNVGIGTTEPSQKLDVAGYVKGQSGLCIGNDCRSSWPGGGGIRSGYANSTQLSFTLPAGTWTVRAEAMFSARVDEKDNGCLRVGLDGDYGPWFYDGDIDTDVDSSITVSKIYFNVNGGGHTITMDYSCSGSKYERIHATSLEYMAWPQ